MQRPCKVVAQRGAKQVGAVVSQERGSLVTICCGINAVGNHIPPYFIFPCVNVQQHWHLTAPPGSAVAGHSKASGWMTCENFIDFMRHFVNHAKPSSQHPVLLLLDNHHSHISLDVINYAKDNHITLLSFPPHCSHQLQPLDKAVYGPFKTFINAASDNWMREPQNAGKSMSIHVIPLLVSYAFPKAFTTTNITSGFRATGIWPFDRHTFPPETFLPSSVTDRPLLAAENGNPSPAADESVNNSGSSRTDHPSTESDALRRSPASCVSAVEAGPSQPPMQEASRSFMRSPEDIRPFPRRSPRKKKTNRKKGKSQILTDTPVKAAIEAERKATKRYVKKRIIQESDDDDTNEESTANNAVTNEPDETTSLSLLRKQRSSKVLRPPRSPSRRLPLPRTATNAVNIEPDETTSPRTAYGRKTCRKQRSSKVLRPPRSPSRRPALPRKPLWLLTKQGW